MTGSNSWAGSWNVSGGGDLNVYSNANITAGSGSEDDGITAWTGGSGSSDTYVYTAANTTITAGNDGIYAWGRLLAR